MDDHDSNDEMYWPEVGALKVSFPVVKSIADDESLPQIINLVYGKFLLAQSPLVELAVLSAWNVVRYAQSNDMPLPPAQEFRELVLEEDARRIENGLPVVEEGGHQGVGMVRLALELETVAPEAIAQLLEETLLQVALLLGVQRVMIEVFSDRRSYRVEAKELHPIS